MPEPNPEPVQDREEEKKRWLPGFAELANKFLNAKEAVTVQKDNNLSDKPEPYRFIAFQTDNWMYRFRISRRGASGEAFGYRATLEWMQILAISDDTKVAFPRWGNISVGYDNTGVSVLAEELPRAPAEDIEEWNKGIPVIDIAEGKYPVNFEEPGDSGGATLMNSRDVTNLLLEARDGRIDIPVTNDMAEFFTEEVQGFFKIPNADLGIKIPVSSTQNISV